MKTLKCLFLALLFFVYGNILAQGEGALPFLTVQPSPEFYSAGNIGAAKPAEDVLGYYYNPAQLGYLSRTNDLSISLSPNAYDFYLAKIKQNSYGLSFGYNFNKTNPNSKLSIGLGFIRTSINYGEIVVTGPDGPEPLYKGDDVDSYNAFSLGVGYEYGAIFNFGMSIKSVKSDMGKIYSDGKLEDFVAEGTAIDVGALIILPVTKLLIKDFSLSIANNSSLIPKLDFSLGYSLSNVGENIYYLDPSQSDPIPRTARLGFNVNPGFEIILENKLFNLFDYSFTLEAEDILIERDTINSISSYKGIFGDISIGKNLILAKAGDEVYLHKGHTFNLFETFTYTMGSIQGPHINAKSTGYGFSSEGIMKLLDMFTDSKIISFISNHIDLRYYYVDPDYPAPIDRTIQGYAVNLKNFGFLWNN